MELDKQQENEEIQKLVNDIEMCKSDAQRMAAERAGLEKENEALLARSAKLEADIQQADNMIKEQAQRMQLNELLKDVDLDELKMLAQNNATVNASISGLISKWNALEGQH